MLQEEGSRAAMSLISFHNDPALKQHCEEEEGGISVGNKKNEFGFTNDPQELEKVISFRDAAIADGWAIKPSYPSESMGRASRLEKEGFIIQVLSRDNTPESKFPPNPNDRVGIKWEYEVDIHIWGPDGLIIREPSSYDWEEIKKGVITCNQCGKEGKTFRFFFAGRACAECLPALKKKYEKPGWDN